MQMAMQMAMQMHDSTRRTAWATKSRGWTGLRLRDLTPGITAMIGGGTKKPGGVGMIWICTERGSCKPDKEEPRDCPRDSEGIVSRVKSRIESPHRWRKWQSQRSQIANRKLYS